MIYEVMTWASWRHRSPLVTEDAILSMPRSRSSMRGGKRYANSSATGCRGNVQKVQQKGEVMVSSWEQ